MNDLKGTISSNNVMPIASSLSINDASLIPRVNKLDSLRFVAAFWVAMSHGALPIGHVVSESFIHRLVRIFDTTFDGVAAVMVFFIISGFCIHMPYVHLREFSVFKFMIRRYVRIGIPLLAVLVISYMIGGDAIGLGHGVLWSIYAELIYYTLYPIIFLLSKYIRWSMLIALSAVISAIIALTHLNQLWVWQLVPFTWLWGLPIWLSGCALAENFQTRSLGKIYGPLWAWRIAAWVLGAAATFGVFHAPVKIGYPVSMLVFSLFAYFWLTLELQFQSASCHILENFGKASYSLYLTHNLVLVYIDEHLNSLSQDIATFLPWVSIAVATFVFYKLVEAPSHYLSRIVSNAIFDFFQAGKKT